jgi:hypothetical protein
MFVRINDVLVNTNLIQYIEVKRDGATNYVNVHFNVGSIKRIRFKNIAELNDFLEQLGSKNPQCFNCAEVV